MRSSPTWSRRSGAATRAFIRIGDWAICSASPELFFELDGLDVRARPMKGTARRGRTLAEDRAQRDELRESAKQRAENVMIVDMMRNDLGRIAEVGSVEVPELFAVERYPNVWQMTSLVTARSPASLEEIFAALHPSASVTGAPKVRTMEILSELEAEPRGVYTGAIGHVPPDGNASFNVAIRTAVVDLRARTRRVRHRQRHRLGLGRRRRVRGVPAEGRACLAGRPRRFELLETLRWTPEEGFFLLDRHLDRLRESAEYFDFALRPADAASALWTRAVDGLTEAQRVRLLRGARRQRARRTRSRSSSAQAPLRVGARRRAGRSERRLAVSQDDQPRACTSGPARRRRTCDDVILWNRARRGDRGDDGQRRG